MSDIYDDYVAMTEATAAYPRDNELAYLTLGACGEAAEFIDKLSTTKSQSTYTACAIELGDLQWYLCRLVLFYKEDWSKIANRFTQEPFDCVMITEVSTLTGQLAEIAKKTLRDGPTWTEAQHLEKKEQVLTIIRRLVAISRGLASHLCYTYEDVLKMNAKKLIDRKERGVIQGSGDNR